MTATLEAPTIQLRDYQEQAIDGLFEWFRTQDGDPLCVLPTGSGKSIVMGTFIARARAGYPALRAVILAMRAELVKQNTSAAAKVMPRSDIGIYSASLGMKQTDKPVTVANIQSLAKRAYFMEPPDIICLDEAQNLADHDQGLLRQYFAAVRQQNPNVKIVGFTATPFKLSSGRLDKGPNALFAGIAYEAPVLDLIQAGYLCRPVTPQSSVALDTTNVATRGGEYVTQDLANAIDVDSITKAAVAEDVALFKDRHHWIVFAITVEHAQHLATEYASHGIATAVVHGELSRDERAFRLNEFHEGRVRCLVSVMLLTEGWDEPQVDAISIMRPSKSAGLYIQIVGRGMRIHPSKTDCLIADHAGLITQFGPVDAIRIPEKNKKGDGEAPIKVCPDCELYQAAGVRVCVGCGYNFPPPAIVLTPAASKAAILSTDQPKEWVAITSVQYNRNEAKPPKTTPTLRVDYYAGYRKVASEWVCVEHDGFARSKAEQWWARRSAEGTAPSTVDDALALADELAKPLEIAIGPDPANPKYTRIADYRFVESPKASGLPKACWSCTHFASNNHCQKWQATPPADVQAIGCDDWTDDDEMPF